MKMPASSPYFFLLFFLAIATSTVLRLRQKEPMWLLESHLEMPKSRLLPTARASAALAAARPGEHMDPAREAWFDLLEQHWVHRVHSGRCRPRSLGPFPHWGWQPYASSGAGRGHQCRVSLRSVHLQQRSFELYLGNKGPRTEASLISSNLIHWAYLKLLRENRFFPLVAYWKSVNNQKNPPTIR